MITSEQKNKLNQELTQWYLEHARDLPWRRTADPYAIWVSEIMLQQTRVETVIAYYHKWLAAFPDLKALALAEEDQVLKLWEGLGYYSRARNLHKAAKIVQESFHGKIPNDNKSLESLPGIGRYTAGAIASIAYDHPAPILDGNIRRVFTRLFNITTPLQIKETEEQLWQIAEDLLPQQKTGQFNQALMELGALVCLPKNPACDRCPLQTDCQAYHHRVQNERPVRKKKTPQPHFQVTAAVIEKRGTYLLAKRPPSGLLGGMWEFPGGKQEENESLPEALVREIKEELGVSTQVGELLGSYDHAYTHYRVTLHVYHCRLVSTKLQMKHHTELAWVPLGSLQDYPMGKLDRLITGQLLVLNSQSPGV